MSAPILVPEPCGKCGAGRLLYVRVRGVLLCSGRWRAAGQPSADDVGMAHEMEVKTRERMTARGGADRHLVRKGLS